MVRSGRSAVPGFLSVGLGEMLKSDEEVARVEADVADEQRAGGQEAGG